MWNIIPLKGLIQRGNSSIHISHIDPITSPEDVVWTATAHDVVLIGYLLMHGRYLPERVISIAGPGIIEGMTGYFKTRAGVPISSLIEGRLEKGWMRLISGDVLMGLSRAGGLPRIRSSRFLCGPRRYQDG